MSNKSEQTTKTIPAGYLFDYISGKQLKETKKELVKQLSEGEEATDIREQLYELHENKGVIEVAENKYELKVKIYEK